MRSFSSWQIAATVPNARGLNNTSRNSRHRSAIFVNRCDYRPTIVDLAGSEEIQSVHLAEALHAPQPPKVDDGIIKSFGFVFSDFEIALLTPFSDFAIMLTFT
jgi:hypothetical protein